MLARLNYHTRPNSPNCEEARAAFGVVVALRRKILWWAVCMSLLLVAGLLSAAELGMKLHLTFDSISADGTVLDQSGSGSDGVQFNRTNLLSYTDGVFGSDAGEFKYVGYMYNDPPQVYRLSQYLAVTNVDDFRYLTNGTISFWAQVGSNGDRSMRVLDTGYTPAYTFNPAVSSNSWCIGRDNEACFSFKIYTAEPFVAVSWPTDVVQAIGTNPDLSTTRFHLYSVTFDCTAKTAISYYDGEPFQTNSIPVPWIRIFGGNSKRWLCVGAMAHAGTPEWGDDRYPNSGFFVGRLDDIRIYDRVLAPAEIARLFTGETAVVSVRAADSVAGEPDTGAGSGTLSFTRTGSLAEPLTVSLAISGTAQSGVDYTALQTTVTFSAGRGTVTRTLNVLDDELHEVDETVRVTILRSTGYSVGTESAVVTIQDDDPAIIIDDTGAVFSGTWGASSKVEPFFGSGYHHDGNTLKGSKSASFIPNIPARGTYEVYLQHSADSDRATNVPVEIVHRLGTNTVRVNQRVNGGIWNLMGVYEFDPGTQGYVRIRNAGTTNYVIADAVKYLRIGTTPPVQVEGNVRYYGSTTAVPGAPMLLTGDAVINTATAFDGAYELWLRPGLDYQVTPVPAGDAPLAKGITTLDIALIRRHILAQEILNSPYKILAADVNASRSITTLDITLMRRVILGITNTYPAGLWRFVPADYVFPDPKSPWSAPTNRLHSNLAASQTGQDFVAIKLGDVNSSWQPPAAPSVSKSSALLAAEAPGIQVSLGRLTAAPGSHFLVPVKVADFRRVTTLQFTLEWDPAVLRFTGVQDLGLPGLEPAHFSADFVSEGKLTVAWDDTKAVGVSLEDATTAFAVGFEAIGKIGTTTTLTVGNHPTPIEASVDLRSVPVTTEPGQVFIAAAPFLKAAPHGAGEIILVVPTEPNVPYLLEYSDSLVTWELLEEFVGDGAEKRITDPEPNPRQRYYRIRQR